MDFTCARILRLTATEVGATLDIGIAPTDGAVFSVDHNGVPGQEFVAPFSQPGVYPIVALIDGAEVGRIIVHVPQIEFVAPIAYHINYQRIKDVDLAENGASVVLAANDRSLMTVAEQSSGASGRRLTLRPLQSGDLSLQARLGEGGPVIASCSVDEFTLRTSAE